MHPVIWHMTRNNSIVQICVSKLGKASRKSEKVPDWLEPTRSHEKTKLFCKVAISYEYVYLICKKKKELAWRSTPEPNLQWEISRLYEKVQMWLYDFIQIHHKFVKIFFLAPESLRVGFLSSANGKWKTRSGSKTQWLQNTERRGNCCCCNHNLFQSICWLATHKE